MEDQEGHENNDVVPTEYHFTYDFPMEMSEMPIIEMSADSITNEWVTALMLDEGDSGVASVVDESTQEWIDSLLIDDDPYLGSSSNIPMVAEPTMGMSLSDKSFMLNIATNSMCELVAFHQTNEPFWKRTIDGKEYLDIDIYKTSFPKDGYLTKPLVWEEASRESGMVMMDGLGIAEIFMDHNKWVQYFPTIVLEANTIEVIVSSTNGDPRGSLRLMSHVVQDVSPLVPARVIHFLRYCQELDQGFWAIVDVSIDQPQDNRPIYPIVRKLPSGCLIEDMTSGYTKVSWIEHVEVEDKFLVPPIIRNHIKNGEAFGAKRWISTLQRISERFVFSPLLGSAYPNILDGVISSIKGRKNLLKLSQLMVTNFFTSISAYATKKWRTLSRADDIQIQAALYWNTASIEPGTIILSAATTVWFPLSPKTIFSFLRNCTFHSKWDVLTGLFLEEIAYVVNGMEPGNRVSIIKGVSSTDGDTEILSLQESSTDASGSFVVYSPITMDILNNLKTEDATSDMNLLPSGCAIIPAQDPNIHGSLDRNMPSTSSSKPVGSFVTIGFQKLLSHTPCEKLSISAIDRAKDQLKNSIGRLKDSINGNCY